MVHSGEQIEIHHGVARSRGGPDDDWNLHPYSEYAHAEHHALDFVLFENAPDFDFRMKGWKLLPAALQEAVRAEKSRRMSSLNPSHKPGTLDKKRKTFVKRGTHNWCTEEGRQRNRERASQRNSLLNRIRCSCLVCHKEVSITNFSKHFRTHQG